MNIPKAMQIYDVDNYDCDVKEEKNIVPPLMVLYLA